MQSAGVPEGQIIVNGNRADGLKFMLTPRDLNDTKFWCLNHAL